MIVRSVSPESEGHLPLADLNTTKVWDPIVRLFHWGVVIGCILNLFVLPEGKTLHRYTGYAIVSLLVVRLIWGFVGTRYARFSDFFPTRRRLHDYVIALSKGQEPRMLGHNPVAAIMMLVLMLLLALTAATGFATTLDAFWGMKWLESLHGLLANSIMVLAGLHAVAAIMESLRHHENLIWSMVTGRKKTVI